MRLVLVAVTALLLLAPTSEAAVPDAGAVPARAAVLEPVGAATPVATLPDDVSAWFAGEAPEHVRDTDVLDVPAEARDRVVVGPPRAVHRWSENFLDGADLDPVSVPGEEWLATLTLVGEGSVETVGTVRAHREGADGELSLAGLDEDTELADVLATLSTALPMIFDPAVDGWFSAADGEVWPLTSGARDLLVGAVPAEVFQSVLAEQYAAADEDPDAAVGGELPDQAADGLSPALVAAAVVLLLGALVAVLLVRQHRRADSRIEADVRAAVDDRTGP
ncbi:hypothetical protein [Georgenia faecalis]|uniref:hypothetical protein n=1 Tax=Georgenia faecalis TaxID=2483799 RepID=UPI000FDC030A|nr:hypothetical protein [Georgenia faecalis]